MSLKIEKLNDLEKIAKYMTEAVKQTHSKKHDRFWSLQDLICHFKKDNGFDYKVRLPIWENMKGFEMPKTYDNIFKILTLITQANEKLRN